MFAPPRVVVYTHSTSSSFTMDRAALLTWCGSMFCPDLGQ
ncbi:Uncharacterised protein [Mycobacteroides abscessus subsp. abscessus]|nr:Uncharacterised protein [Mycobacteroides abscessus subsp. abscessus]SHW47899.1 Uncharacterised protein [Mycobacteroides abscessus subsp. abscessus]